MKLHYIDLRSAQPVLYYCTTSFSLIISGTVYNISLCSGWIFNNILEKHAHIAFSIDLLYSHCLRFCDKYFSMKHTHCQKHKYCGRSKRYEGMFSLTLPRLLISVNLFD